jgi:hypothetical protein
MNENTPLPSWPSAPPEMQTSTPGSCSFGPSTWMICMMLLVALGAVGWMGYRSVAANRGPQWRQATALNVTLDAPCELSPAEMELPANIRKLTRTAEQHAGRVGRDSFHIEVIRFSVNPSQPLSIDGAIDGCMRGTAEKLGDARPKFTTQALTVAGLNARRGTYTTTVKGRPVRVDALVVLRGPVMWGVLTAADDSWKPADIERVFASVDIAH